MVSESSISTVLSNPGMTVSEVPYKTNKVIPINCTPQFVLHLFLQLVWWCSLDPSNAPKHTILKPTDIGTIRTRELPWLTSCHLFPSGVDKIQVFDPHILSVQQAIHESIDDLNDRIVHVTISSGMIECSTRVLNHVVSHIVSPCCLYLMTPFEPPVPA